MCATLHTSVGHLVMMLVLPYSVLYAAFWPAPLLSRFGSYGDFSYGLYVFGFPVQQLILHFFGPQIQVSVLLAASFVITLGFAALSWHLVEHPALKCKQRRILRPLNKPFHTS